MPHTFQTLKDASKIVDSSQNHEYAVYSYGVAKSEKKGQIWRQHGVSNNKDEALWIAEQLEACAAIERIEIRLQGIDPRTQQPHHKRIKVIDKSSDSAWDKFKRLLPI